MPARSDVATDNPVPTPPFWGTRVVKGIPLADYAALLDERATVHGPVGPQVVRGGRAVVRGAGRDRGPAAAADVAGPAARRGHARAARRLRLLPGGQRGGRPGRAHHGSRRSARERRRSPSRASGATGTCASPTSSARGSRGRSTCSACSSSPWAADRRGDRGAVRAERLPRLPRAARPVGAADRGARGVLAQADPGRAGLRRRGPGPGEDYFDLGYRGARFSFGYAPAPTSRTGPSWSTCSSRSGSASSSPRSSSCTPSSPPTRWCSTTPRRSTSTPSERRPHVQRAPGGAALRHGRPPRRHRGHLVRGGVRADGSAGRPLGRGAPARAVRRPARRSPPATCSVWSTART